MDNKTALEAFANAWTNNISKIPNPSKDAQNTLTAIKTAFMDFIPVLLGELAEARHETTKLREQLEATNRESPTLSIDSETDAAKETFSTRYACNQEVKRVQNSLIVEFRQDHTMGKGKNMPGPDFVKDINIEMAKLKDRQDKKPADLKPGDMKWTKLSNPRTGAHADSQHYRLTLNRSYSKKALFNMLKYNGQTKYGTSSFRNETPGFLRHAKHSADHIASMIRAQTNKDVRTRVIFDAKRQAMALQTAVTKDGVTTYVTHASSDPDPKQTDIRKLPAGDSVTRGQPDVEFILQQFQGYTPHGDIEEQS